MFSPPLLLFKSNVYPSCPSREGNNASLSLRSFSRRKALPSLLPRSRISTLGNPRFHNKTCVINKTDRKGQAAEPARSLLGGGFRGETSASITRGSDPAENRPGKGRLFPKSRDFVRVSGKRRILGRFLGEAAFRNYLEVSL